MQVSKTFSGEVTLEEATVKRLVSYGAAATSAVYPSKVDTVNTIIADFLRGTCGVDAWYGAKGEVEDSFLWIYGAPFLFNISGANNYAQFYGPCYGSAISSDRNTSNYVYCTMFADNAYSFGLVFAGNPENGFCLRIKTYNSNYPSAIFAMRFMKCSNLINGSDAVVFSGRITDYASSSSDNAPAGMNGIDLSGPGGLIAPASFSSSVMTYTPLLQTKKVHKTANEGALPLVPLCVGPYRANGIYLRPIGFALPNSVGASVEVLPEITISGRSFLLTNSDSFSAGYINMGLIETT